MSSGETIAVEWSTVAAAAIGAFAGIGGGVALEMFKRRRDRIGTAFALVGAIRASVREVEMAGVVAALEAMANRCDLDPTGPFREAKMFSQAPVKPNMIVFEKYIDKLGLIDPRLSEGVILWFSTYAGLQHILWQTMQKAEQNNQASAIIRKGLEAWSVAAMDAPRLVSDLESSTKWWRRGS